MKISLSIMKSFGINNIKEKVSKKVSELPIVFVKIYGVQRHCKCVQVVVCTFSVRGKERKKRSRTQAD